MCKYDIFVSYSDHSQKQFEFSSHNIGPAYNEAFKIALQANKGINELIIKKKPG